MITNGCVYSMPVYLGAGWMLMIATKNFGEKSEADSSSLFSMVKPDLSAYRDVNTCTHVCIASCMVLSPST